MKRRVFAAHGVSARVENPCHFMRSGASAAPPLRTRLTEKPRGFASIMAVVLLGLVTIAAFSIFAMLTADARRTRGAELDAQLRQMLTAGAADATARSSSWDEKAVGVKQWNVELPEVLKQEGGAVTVTPRVAPDGTVVISIDSTLQNRAAYETLTLARSENRWVVSSSRWGR